MISNFLHSIYISKLTPCSLLKATCHNDNKEFMHQLHVILSQSQPSMLLNEFGLKIVNFVLQLIQFVNYLCDVQTSNKLHIQRPSHQYRCMNQLYCFLPPEMQ
jgi:hypothetical protein